MTESETRARIRDAALRQFAEHGFKGATIRGIAKDAGVSPGLVQHHFPSKRALREECDTYAAQYVRVASVATASGTAPLDETQMSEALDTIALLTPYLAMALVGDTAFATRWFDELADLYRDILTSGTIGPPIPQDADVEGIVTVYAAMNLGLTILAGQMYRRLGADQPTAEVLARLGKARIFLSSHHLLDEANEERMRQGFDDYQRKGTDRDRESGGEGGEGGGIGEGGREEVD